MITALSQYTVQNMLDKFRWGNLSEAQKISILNSAQEELATFVNTQTDRTDYNYNVINDADDVLAPTTSGLSALYDDYIQLKFTADVNHDGSNVAHTDSKYRWSLSSATASDDGTLITYTITLSNTASNVIDGHTEIHCSTPKATDITKVNGTSFTVIASYGHTDEFSIYVKNWKES